MQKHENDFEYTLKIGLLQVEINTLELLFI